MGCKEKTRTENKEDSNPTKFQQQKAKEDIQILLLETNVFTNIYTYISVYNTHIYNQPEREKLGKDYTNRVKWALEKVEFASIFFLV